ncbi:MAG: PIN domain-containing protein [Acidimicrobiales bacterium]
MKLAGPTAIVLDTTPLGLITQRPGHVGGDACRAWYGTLSGIGCRFFVPEIADYEVRRELLRAKKADGIQRLDDFISADPARYLPLTTEQVRRAALLWAQARQGGLVTAPPEALDGDVLIAAQAESVMPADFSLSGRVVATQNVRHFGALTTAVLWSDLIP